MVSAAFLGVVLIEGRRSLERGAYFNLNVNDATLIRVWRLLENPQLLEEIQYSSA